MGGGLASRSSLTAPRAWEVGMLVGSRVRKTQAQIPALLCDGALSSVSGEGAARLCWLGTK